MIISITGCACSGKDTIVRLLKERGIAQPLVSHTSRPPRANEINGRDYHFVSKNEMLDMIWRKEFISNRDYKTVEGTWYYGLHKNALNDIENNNYVVILDYMGSTELFWHLMREGKANYLKSVYIDCDPKLRIERYLQRDNMDEKKIAEMCRRYLADEKEIAIFKDRFNCIIPNNNEEDLENAIKLIKKLFDK